MYLWLHLLYLTQLDDIVNKVAQCKIFSTVDLKSAYHQVPINKNDRKFTAFEANSRLFQFKQIPFGIENGVLASNIP